MDKADTGRAGRDRRRGPARLVVGGAWASNIGDGIRMVGLPLLAATVTDRAVLIAAVPAASMLPGAVLGAPLGVIVDRVDRRKLALGADLARLAVAGFLAMTVATGTASITLVLAAALALGIGETFRDLVGAALIADAVDDAELEAANGSLIAAEAAGNTMLGPMTGSLLWTWARPLPFLADALALGTSVLFTRRLTRVHQPEEKNPGPRADGGGRQGRLRRIRRELGGALRLVTASSQLRRIAAVSFLMQLALFTVYGVEILWARDRLGIGAVGLGAMNAVGAVGAITGSLHAGRITARVGAHRVVPASFAVNGIGFVVFGASTSPIVVFAGLFFTGAVLTVGDASLRAARVRAAGAQAVGRVSGVMRTVLWTGGITGALASGLLADSYGLGRVFWVAAALSGVGLATSVRWPAIERADR